MQIANRETLAAEIEMHGNMQAISLGVDDWNNCLENSIVRIDKDQLFFIFKGVRVYRSKRATHAEWLLMKIREKCT